MIFWDTSAVVPLLVREPRTDDVLALLSSDPEQVVWWGTRAECVSAMARSSRAGGVSTYQEAQARVRLQILSSAWREVLPTYWVRAVAEVLLDRHPLKAADALQLAAAVALCQGQTQDQRFACLDRQLGNAAIAEGFKLIP